MRSFFLSLTTLFIFSQATAQSAEDSVKTVINTMFLAMKNVDTALLRSTFTDQAILQTFGRPKDGKLTITDEKVSDFATSISGAKKNSLDERIVFDVVKVDGPLAIVWTPYNFFYNGEFSHCGVNSFQLVRLDGTWKIQYLIDTRRKAGCKQ